MGQAPLYLIDSFAIIFKNYYAMIRSPLTNMRGENVSALLGFIKQVQQILRHAQQQNQAPHMAMILDSPGPTFRHQIYPEYKANRDQAPEDLIAQLAYLDELLEKWGLPTYKSSGYEADDLIATLAKRASSEGKNCYIVTRDKDLYQLVDEHVHILELNKGQIAIHKKDYVVEKWQVQPQQIRDYLALVGDSSDNVAGVKGIGPKGAAKLLTDYQNLQNIYEHIESIKPESLRKKLVESKDNAFLSYELVGLAEQVPELLQVSWPNWPQLWQQFEIPVSAYSQSNVEFANFLAHLGLDKLSKEFGGSTENKAENQKIANQANYGNDLLSRQRWALTPPMLKAKLEPENKNHSSSPRSEQTPKAVLQNYQCICSEEQLNQWCKQIAKQKIVAMDTETEGLNELSDALVGISLATSKNHACYIPIKANQPGNFPLLSSEIVRQTLAKYLGPDVRIVGQNFKFDYKVLAQWGLKIPNIYFDTMIAAWLLDSLHPVSMDTLALRYLNIKPIHFQELVPKAKKGQEQKTFADVVLEQAVQYAAQDADITWQLYEAFAPMLNQQGLETLFFQLEMPLVHILAEMELRGIGCKRSKLEDYATELKDELKRLENKVYTLTTENFNLNSPQQLATILFDKLKLPAGKKTKTGYSTDNSILEKLLHFHPVIASLLEYRRLHKLHSTYVKSLPDMILPQTQRIHTHFSLIGTETGRLSCKDPNLQNIPIKDTEGRRIRSAFQPQPGWGFFSADYSQIELVVLAHFSTDLGLCHAFHSTRDIHQQTASQLFNLPPEKVTSEQRRIAKSINFGVIYGMSAFRLSQDLGLTRYDAQNFIEAYFREFSGVKSFIAQTVEKAMEQGFVQTLAGRRRKIRQLRSNNKNERNHGERMAVNTLIQGSAADIVKQAMIMLDKELLGWQSQLLLQVHDELIFEVPLEEKDRLQTLVLDVMENAYSLEVPLKVNGEWSTESWGALH